MPLFDYAKLTNVVCFLKCFTSHMYNEISYLTAIYGHSFSHALLFIFVCLFVCLFCWQGWQAFAVWLAACVLYPADTQQQFAIVEH